MSYALVNRVADVRRRLAGQNPPAASLAYAVLNRWTAGRDTWVIADRLKTSEAEVCRIIAADQDCRRTRKSDAA